MIHVIATIELASGTREAFLTEFRRIVPLVRAEAGCLEYGPTVDLATDIAAQVPPRNEVVVVVEKWASVEALKSHLAAPHMTDYRSRVKDYVVSAKLQVLQPA
jgi:quinol monooxygenase YgiN